MIYLLLAVEQAIAMGEFEKDYLDVVVAFFEDFAQLVKANEFVVDTDVSSYYIVLISMLYRLVRTARKQMGKIIPV